MQMSWHHIILTAYGAWLPGDPRGFRTRHHREHVEGDYKNPPPPGRYAERHEHSKTLLVHEATKFPDEFRPFIGKAVREKIEKLGGEVIAIAVAERHVHLLAKVAEGEAKNWGGHAKRHAWFEMRNNYGWKKKMWAKYPWARAIEDREDQLNVHWYIVRHRDEGAWVWHYLEG